MQVGDLVRVRNTSTADTDIMIRLYRDKVPMLLLEIREMRPHCLVLEGGQQGWIDEYRLEVVSRANR